MDVAHILAMRIARSRRLGPRLDRIATTISNLHRGFTFDARENGEVALVRAVTAIGRDSSHPFVFVDVGAHLGTWTDHVLEHLGERPASGHLFEPTPELHAGLLARFEATDGVTVHPEALADFAGTFKFALRGGTGGSNSLQGEEYLTASDPSPETIDVTVKTGDPFALENGIGRIDLMKIDTEGWDLDVLRGFSETLRLQRVDVIQFEYALPNARTRRLMTDFYAFLEPLGYEIGALRPDGVRFAPHSLHANHFSSGPNYVAALPAFVPALRGFVPV